MVNRKHQQPKPDHRLSFGSAFVLSPQCCKRSARAKHDNAYRQAQLQVPRPTDAVNINSVGCIQLHFGSTRLVVEHANVLKCGPLQRPAFPRGIKSSCGRPGACRSKQYELKQNAEFIFGVNPQGSFQKCFKDALTSQGKSFRSAVHATTSRVLSKKEPWQEWNECQMPASNYMHSKR